MSFRDVVGHRTLVDLLARSIERGSLPPSLILAGPTGIGKHLTAIAAAQALNCEVDKAGCGACAVCTRIARGAHPDVMLLGPGDTGSIKIEAVRDAVDRSGYRPFEGRHRVVIIDEADALVTPAQNALLKTLEEPPSLSYFMLITSRPDALLPTVRSRCPRLRFRPLEADDVAAVLVRQGRNEAEARAVAAAADGSVGRALESSAEEMVEAREAAMRALAAAAESGGKAEAGQGARAAVPRRLGAAKDLLAKAGGAGLTERELLATRLRAMASLLRDVALVTAGGDQEALANADQRPFIDGLHAFQGDRVTHAFASVDRALVALDRNLSAKIVADWVMLEL